MEKRYVYKARRRSILKVTKHSRVQRKYFFISQMFRCLSGLVKVLDNTGLLLSAGTYFFPEAFPNPRAYRCDKLPYSTFINIA